MSSKLTIDLSGRGGLAPRFWGDVDRTVATPELRILGKESQMANGMYNPFRRYGYLSPSNAVTTNISFATTVDGMLSSTIYDPVENDFYVADSKEQIFLGEGLDDIALYTTHDLGTTGTPQIMDLEIYQLNAVRKLFYVYKKSGNLNIGTATLPCTAENDDWLTADVAGAFTNTLTNYAFMRVADNGFAYIFQDNNIHKLDGSTTGGAQGTISANVIAFPAVFQIVDAIDYRGNLFVAIHQDTRAVIGTGFGETVYTIDAGIYIWDRQTTVANMSDYIPLLGVKQIRKIYIAPSGEVRLIVVNSENITEIRKFNGSTFEVIEEPGIKASPNFHDSLTTVGGMSVWLGQDGNFYAHGKPTPFDEEGLFKIGNISETIPTYGVATGAILFGGANADSGTVGWKGYKSGLYAGYRTATDFKMLEWDIYGTGSDGVLSTQEQGDVYTLVKYLPQMSNVNYIDIYMFPGGDDGSSPETTAGRVKIYFNQSSSAWASKVITRGQSANGYRRIEINKPYVNSIQLEIEFSESTAVGTFDFAPSYAVVDYTPTTTKG